MKLTHALLLATSLTLVGCQPSGQLGTIRDEHNDVEVTSTYPNELMRNTVPQPEQVEPMFEEPIGALENNAAKTAQNQVTNAPATAVQSNQTPSTAEVTVKPQIKKIKPVANKFTPNEGHLIRGNELLEGLKSQLGRQPTRSEMQKHLQSHMGLSTSQAKRLTAMLQLQ